MADKRKVAMLRIRPELHHRLKVLAAKEKTTIQALTEEFIEGALNEIEGA